VTACDASQEKALHGRCSLRTHYEQVRVIRFYLLGYGIQRITFRNLGTTTIGWGHVAIAPPLSGPMDQQGLLTR